MHRPIASALILSVAAHVAATAGYWLWGGHSDSPAVLPVVQVALVMDAAEPSIPAEAVHTAPEPVPVKPEPRPKPETIAPPRPEPEVPKPRAAAAPDRPDPPRPRTTATVAKVPEAAPAPVDPGLIASVEQAYKSALQAEIARHRSYPKIAVRLRQEGTVEVGFVVLADGRLTDIELIDSSGYELLDHAAIKAVRDVRQFRPIPSELARERWNLSVPLNFRRL